MATAADYWRGNTGLREITPSGERFPEVGLFPALQRACFGAVFEFGCGDGRLSPAFAPGLYSGFDINPSALQAASKANPGYRYVDEMEPADTFLAHTVLLHVPDDEIGAVMELAKGYERIVIGEVMGRGWRRPGDPPVFNREIVEYVAMSGRGLVEAIAVPYPRYRCDLMMLVLE